MMLVRQCAGTAPSFGTVRPAIILSVLLLYAGQFLVPAFIVGRFIAERERVERELCVQRERAEGMRTCHGECHVMKQLRAAEDAAADHAPPRLPKRTQPETWSNVRIVVPIPPVLAVEHVEVITKTVSRPFEPLEHVPWC